MKHLEPEEGVACRQLFHQLEDATMRKDMDEGGREGVRDDEG